MIMTVLNDAISGVLGGLASVLGNAPTDDETSHVPAPPPGTSIHMPWPWNRDIDLRPPPRSQTPPVPASPEPVAVSTEMSGDMAKTLRAVQDAQRQATSDTVKADEKLAEVMLQATSKSQQGKDRLFAIQRQIMERVDKAGPPPWSPSTETDVAEFVHGKIGDIKDVMANAELDSKSLAAAMNAVDDEYKATTAKTPTQPGQQQPAGQPSGQPTPAPPAPAPPAPAPAPAPQPEPGGDELGGLGAGDDLGSIVPGLANSLGQLPATAGGMNPAMFMPPGAFGGTGGFGDRMRDMDDDRPHHHEQDDEAKPEPLKDQGEQNNGQPKPAEAKPEPLKDQGAAQAGQQGQTPVGAAPTAAAAAPEATAVTLPNSTETRQAASPALAQAVNGVVKGGDIDTEFTKAHLQLPPMGQLDANPVDQTHIALGTVGQFTDHRVVALSDYDAFVNGQVVPISQLDTKNGSFVGWVNPAPVNAPAPQPAPVS